MSPPRSRWCPTPEQRMILDELYRRGLTNPNTSQIQRITAHLSHHGKIQGKNVFYWFQNRKARERQKIKKLKLANQLHQQHLLQQHHLQYFQYQQYHQLFYSYSPQILHPQATQEGMMKQITLKTSDLSEDCLIRTHGHDLRMVMEDVGSTFSCCKNRPLETLQLFPISSPTVKDQETSTAASPTHPRPSSIYI